MSPQRPLGLLVASTLCWGIARSCGVLVHNEVLHRSTHLFALPNSLPDLSQLQKLISPLLLSPSNAPSIQAGAFFPDWGYQCLSTDDDAEAAHWPPFLVASVEHIVSKYGFLNDTSRPSEEQEHLESLISFIFAIAGHQTQDATWHAIRFPTGFLAALAGIDFDNDDTKAHRVLDFGGDFVMATRLARMENLSRAWIKDEWRVPIKDLIAIYARVGRDVKSLVLRYCTMRGLAALRSDLAVGPSLYNSMASQSPMLLNSLDDYYLGGIDEMAARTVSCWSNLTRWFAHGIDRDEKLRNGWGICDVFKAIKARGGAGNSIPNIPPPPHPHEPWGTGLMLQRSKKEFEKIKVRTDRFGAEIYTLPPLDRTHSEAPIARAASTRSVLSSAKAPKLEGPTYLATYTPYSHFGASMSIGEFSTSGPALAVGAPRETEDSARPSEGNVYILLLSDILGGSSAGSALQPEYVSPLQLATPLRASITAGEGGVTDQRFGIASTGWTTLNMTFLAVAAAGPYTYDPSTPPSLPFMGNAPAGRIDLFKPGQASRFLSFSIKGAELGSIGRRWLGENMISADLDGSGAEFLIVGGSRSDAGRVCEGRTKIQFGEGEVAVFQLKSSEGTAAHVEVDLEAGKRATTSTADITMNTWSISLPSSEKVGVPCSTTATYEQFGRALSFLPGSRTLLVGAPGVGKIFAYRFHDDAFTLVYTITSPVPRKTLRTGFGGSGIATGSAGGKEWIVVGAADEDVDGDLQAGVVRIYILEDSPRLVAEVVAAPGEGDVVIGGGRKYGKFGRTIVGDGAGGVWVGSEFWDGEKGGVWWVDVGGIITEGSTTGVQGEQKVLKTATVGRYEVETYVKGEEANGRFATSLAVGGGGELFVGVPYSGVAREDQEMRFYGAVAAFRK